MLISALIKPKLAFDRHLHGHENVSIEKKKMKKKIGGNAREIIEESIIETIIECIPSIEWNWVHVSA